MDKTIGVIGLGSVGKCVYHTLSYYYDTTGYDVLGDYSWKDILRASVVFICVPTPEGQDGRLECSIVKDTLSRLDDDGYSGVVVVKSTVGVGFMDASEREHPALRIVYMPEFLREKDNLAWFVAPDRLVTSGSKGDVDEVLGLSHEIIRQDIDVNEEDLKTKCVFLFGRPGTNKITQRFKDIFPIKLHEDKFTWQGTTYNQPTQGVAQIVENPLDPESVVVLYTALSSDAIQRFHGLYLYDTDTSYVIFDRDKQLISGDWEDYDNDLVWKFE